jgi:shikimate kinase
MILKLKRTPGIYLVGFMAAGKTTIGQLLAHELGWSFADVDEDIVAAQGSSIAEIFDARGEREFRTIEQEAVRKRVSEIVRGRPMVVALGGGAFAQDATRALLEENGVSIWLDCPFPTVCRWRAIRRNSKSSSRIAALRIRRPNTGSKSIATIRPGSLRLF